MEERDVEGAMAHILAVTQDDPAKRRRAVFDNVRSRILRQEHYRNPEGYAQLQQLAMRDDLSPTDRVKLQTLLFKPLHFMRWAQVHRCFLTDPDVQAKLAEIPIVKDPFYEFDCPENIKLLVNASIQDGVNENHCHKKKSAETYRFTPEEVNKMIEDAVTLIQQDLAWEKRSNSLRLLECLCLLTGRRKWELCSSLKIRTVKDSEYQADVQGIGKNLLGIFDDGWIRIPLLAPISVVIRGITNLRLYDHTMGRYNGFKKLFPRLTHTHYRDLYSEKCYELREINKFCQGDSCSQLEWRRRALNITMAILANRYSTMLITDERLESEDGQKAVAGQAGGPQEHVEQDPLRCGGECTDQQGGAHVEC
jgi:hypothetical protein